MANDAGSTMTWTSAGPRLARLEVVQSNGLRRAHELSRWSFALDGRERVALQNHCPDCEWEVEVCADSEARPLPTPPDARQAYQEFAAGSSAPDGAPALAALPAGRYWIVRTPRRPVAVPYVVLGNEAVEAGVHQQLLIEGAPEHHAAVIGAPGMPPGLDRPLVGVALSGFGGLRHGAVALLSLGLGGDTRSQVPAGADLIVVVPASGDLVVSWYDEETTWEPGAAALAARLAAPPSPTRLDFRYDSVKVAGLRVDREEIPAIQAVDMGRGVELCAAGERALVVDAKAEDSAGWQVRSRPFTRLPDREPAWDFLEPYLSWEEGSLARAGLGVFDGLPAGDYVLVRTPARTLARFVDQGGPGHAVEGLGGVRLGLQRDDVGQPLVAVVVLGAEGEEVVQVVPLLDAPALPCASDGDAIMILPATGPLVVDPRRRGPERAKPWRHRARELARVLARDALT